MKSKMKENKNIQCNIYEDSLDTFVFTQPAQFIMGNKEYEVSTWVELIDHLCVILMRRNSETFETFLNDEKRRRTRIAYMSRDEQQIHFVKQLERSGIYLNQKIDAPRCVKLICKLLDKFKIDKNEICLYVKLSDRQKRIKEL
ncbi:hypothetical protein [Lacrimispora amygdalina]|uniref:hypothetical protein n=1 Tax=Lacrimispora amygdalina TaxID=253257 RepID=UPI000BE4739B|nr:hypothetical protein [Lacrimispora amygdalina]